MKRFLGFCVLVLFLGAAWFGWRNLGRWMSSPDRIAPVDVIVVPSGDPEYRLPAAFALVKQDVANEVWVSLSSDGPIVGEPDAVLAEAGREGLEGRVRLLRVTTSIPDDARAARAELERRGRRRVDVAVVTTPWNVARARLTFSRILSGRANVVAWAADDAPYDADEWWKKDAETTWTEAAKLVGTMLTVGTRPAAPGPPVGPGRALVALGGALGVALALGGLCRVVARRLGIVALPRLWRAHPHPVPLLGGLAILGGTGAGILLAGRARLGPMGVVTIVGVVVLAVVGVLDDLTGLGARARLVWAASAGAAAWLLGLRANVLTDVAGAEVVNAVVTVVWFMGITHAMNLLDHLDGSAAGVGAASALSIAVIALFGGQSIVAVAAAGLAGACLGYLVYNFYPARLYMGDMGALAIGFVIAALALSLRPPQRPPLSMAVAVLAAAVPIVDVTVVTLSRIRSGHPVSVGATDHSTHRIVQRGLSPRKAAAVLWTAQLGFGVGALSIAAASRTMGWALAVFFGALGAASIIGLLRLPAMIADAHRPQDLLDATDRALDALRSLDGGDATLTSVDAASAKAVRATARRLERVRRRLAD